jgi:uncharacterized membrane protein YhfC
MIATGAVPMLYWRNTRAVSAAPFFFGMILWIAAIVPKFAIDLTIGESINSLATTLGATGALIFIGLYVGLRTGAFESGLSYLAFLKSKLRNATHDEAIGFGLAFGGIEAIILGIGSFLNILVFVLNPSLMEQIPLSQREGVLSALNAPSIMVFAPIIERASSILIHLFATMLIYAAIINHRPLLFLISFLYRATIDAMVPGFNLLVSTSPDPFLATYAIESVIAIYGLLGLLGVRRLQSKMRRAT